MSSAQLRRFLIRNVLWIGLVALVAAAAAYAWASSHERYTAQADLLFQPADPGDDLGLSSGNRTPVDAQTLATAQLSVVTSPRVVKRAADVLKADREDVLGSVSAKPDSSAPMVHVSATSDDADDAAARANAVARAYVVERLAARRRSYHAAADELNRQLAGLLRRAQELRAGGGPRSAQQRAELDAVQEQYRTTYGQQRTALTKASLVTPDVSIVARATPPADPNRAPIAMAIVGGLLGAIAGFGAALARERTGSRLRERDDLGLRARDVLLAEVPKVRTRGRAGRHGAAITADALGRFWIHARLAGGSEPRSILVTSAAAGEGKSFVTERLATALAARGRSVVVVSGDVRNPTIERRFGIGSAEAGLTDMLLPEAPDEPERSVASMLFPTVHDRLRVLPNGTAASHGLALMQPSAVALVLERLQDEADVIIFDSSPVLAAPEPLVLAEAVDLVLVVAAVGRTALPELDAALDQLAPAARNLGVVLNRTEAPRGYHQPLEPPSRKVAV